MSPSAPVVDLRSDAVTRPTEAMWSAMRQAKPGWALAGDDPHVEALEARGALLTGMEAALLVPSGTAANLLALMVVPERGDRILLEAKAHILWAEESGYASLCGLAAHGIPGEHGAMPLDALERALCEESFGHRPRPGLVCLENTHNAEGGTVLTPAYLDRLVALCRRHEVPVHVDGARLFNAAAALGVPLSVLCRGARTVTLNLNKGLSAPYGALLCGARETIARARPALRRLGSASVHQAGILAAACLAGIDHAVEQCREDNQRAGELGARLAALDLAGASVAPVHTNIVLLQVPDADGFAAALRSEGVLVSRRDDRTIRLVTHRHIGADEIDRALVAIERCRHALKVGRSAGGSPGSR